MVKLSTAVAVVRAVVVVATAVAMAAVKVVALVDWVTVASPHPS